MTLFSMNRKMNTTLHCIINQKYTNLLTTKLLFFPNIFFHCSINQHFNNYKKGYKKGPRGYRNVPSSLSAQYKSELSY